MELLYLWIENYRNIQHQGFNFSSKWKFDYQNEQLSVEERPITIDNFFGEDIVNLTALVGANGCGKTSVLEFIYNELFSNDNETYQQLYSHNFSKNIVTYVPIIDRPYAPYSFFFFVIEGKENLLNIKHLSSIKINKLSFSNSNIVTQIGNSPRSLKPASIFYSPFITKSNFKHQYYDITTKKSVFNSDYYNNYAQAYFHYQTRDTINFLDSDLYKEETFPFKVLDSQISLQFFVPTITYYEEQVSKLQQRLETSEFVRSQDLDFFNLITSSFVYKFKATHKETIFCLCLTSMIISAYESFSWGLSDINNINNHLISDSFSYNLPTNSHSDKTPNISIQEYTEILLTYLIELLSNKIQSIVDFFHKIIQKDTHSYLRITQEEALSIYAKEEEFYGLIKEQLASLNCHSSEIKSMPKFAFTRITMRGLSSGERHVFQLFERFYRLKQGLKNSPYLLILIDEGETSLHPQWQKQYIKRLTQTLPLIFKNIPLQIILTSHSPFIVSDLPKENIIFLDTDEQNNAKVVDGLKQKETFGANIHTLFTDAFFMDGGLMGDFAKEKINAVITYLNEGPSQVNPVKTNEQAQQYINLIGEPIVKRQLQKMLDSRRLTKVDNNKKDIDTMRGQLDFLKQQVAELEKRIKPLDNDRNKS
ncbi:ATP-binding protein [Aureispira anguillae]|uniref:ATP-binding protein n=1 Tax=Aureispira anguillae TaxID=2864201 RepID=A0A916DXX4_9BACT|nr:ATP-binding protein [Aureispira anguillae]BDS15491.1 ATP-binding protein [Aureispira anguillae]